MKMNRRNFLSAIAGAMAYAGLKIEKFKAPEIAIESETTDPVAIPTWPNFYVMINGQSWPVEDEPNKAP